MGVEVGVVQFAGDEEENGADRVESAVASGLAFGGLCRRRCYGPKRSIADQNFKLP